MCYPNSMYRKGFTYIEVMIVIGIIALMASMIFAVYTQVRGRQTLKTESQRFVNVLDSSRRRANANDKACSLYNGTYTIEWTTSGYTVTPGGCSAEPSYSLPSTITIDAAGTATYKATGLTTAADCMILQDSETSQCRKIDVEAGGVVNEQIESDCSCP